MRWEHETRLKVRAATVFQGGGIRGLFFPGHVVGLDRKGIGKIFVYAGASAGALVATGIWSGLRPHELKRFLSLKCGLLGLAGSIFSASDVAAIALSWLGVALLAPVNWLLRFVCRVLSLVGYWRDDPLRINVTPGCAGIKFEALINEMILAGLRERGIHGGLIGDLFHTDPKQFYPTFRDILRLIYWIRLVEGIQSKEDRDLEQVLLIYPSLNDKLNELSFEKIGSRIRNNIWRLVYGRDTARDPFFAPIFISTSCVDDHDAVIFNNIEEKYWDIPIAQIVRASAGHPVVFRPVTLKLDTPKRYTDGGLLANFPAFTVNQELRRLFNRHAASKLPGEFHTMAAVPFVTLGLAASDERLRKSYLGEVRSILLGGARERLEYQLAGTASYFRLIRHDVRGEPHLLNFFRVRPKLIDRSFERAISHINSIRMSTTIDVNPEDVKKSIERNLNGVIKSCVRVFQPSDDQYLRVHLYLEGGDKAVLYSKKAVVCWGRSVDEFRDLFAPVTREFSGLIGLARSSGCPVISRLDILQGKRAADKNREFLGLKWEETQGLPADLNLSVIIPIIDHKNMTYETGELLVHEVPGCEDCVTVIDTGIAGPFVGVLLIDGCAALAAKENSELVNFILESDLLETLERYALEIGCIVSQEIAKTLDPPLLTEPLGPP